MGILLRHLDKVFNRLYSSKYNPIYKSGSIALGLFLIVTVTGIYLSFFYRLGQPYESVTALNSDPWFGSWIRALHRYSTDLMAISVGFHIVRMFVERKAWGPRMLAWLSGVGLLVLLLISTWTGYVMVWDSQAQALAVAGAKIFDSWGLFPDPISRSFNGIEIPPASFFFLNLFLHVVVPLGMLFGVWAHTSRIARTDWLPSRRIMYGMTSLLILVSVIWPAPLGSKANLLQRPGEYPLDWIFNFWIPWADHSPFLVFLVFMAGLTILSAAPWYLKSKDKSNNPAFNDPNICEGCTQCVQDCPYEAIQMVSKDVRSILKTVAEVNPALCVSCGLCSASCEPMTIGPEGRKAGDQIKAARRFLTSVGKKALDQTLIIGCQNQPGVFATIKKFCSEHAGYQFYAVDCPGTVHTAVYQILAAQFSKVIIASCPGRNCLNKDGYMLLTQRLSGEREPTLLNPSLREKIHVFEVGDGEEARFFKLIQSGRDLSEMPSGSSWWKRLSIVGSSLILIVVAAGLTRLPAQKSPETGLLRLSIRLVGQNEKDCRKPTQEELAKLPRHMRSQEVCTYRSLSYQLKLNIDGKEYFDEQVHPGGFKKDRPIYVSREIELEPGTHNIAFYMQPLDSEDSSIVSMDLQEDIQFHPGGVVLIHYSSDKRNAVVKGVQHEQVFD